MPYLDFTALHHVFDWLGAVAIVAGALYVIGEMADTFVDWATAKVVIKARATVVQFPRRSEQ
jgi:hypothetical protein